MSDLAWRDGAMEEEENSEAGIDPKILIGGVLIVAAVVMLAIATSFGSGQPFISVEELLSRPDLVGRTVQTSGVVLGTTITFQDDPMELHFTVVNITSDMAHIEEQGGLAEALHLAANDPDAPRMPIVVLNQAMPDLLQHEAQAILTGSLGEDGIFYATDLMLKCPTRYDDAVPDQVDPAS